MVNVPPRAGASTPSEVHRGEHEGHFICGGAFEGLERSSSAGWAARALLQRGDQEPRGANAGEILAEAEPEDLLRTGLFREWWAVARHGHAGDPRSSAMLEILTKPRNAITKVSQVLRHGRGGSHHSQGALEAVRRWRSRAAPRSRLRAVLEEAMLDVMYDIPPRGRRAVQITEDVISRMRRPRDLRAGKQRRGA